MKHVLTLVTLLAATLVSPAAHAGADANCHFHGKKPAAEATVLTCASQYKDQLAGGGKIDASWKTVTKPEKMEQIDGKRSKEWKIVFKNPAATDKTKETLFLFYSLSGNLIAANHSGE